MVKLLQNFTLDCSVWLTDLFLRSHHSVPAPIWNLIWNSARGDKTQFSRGHSKTSIGEPGSQNGRMHIPVLVQSLNGLWLLSESLAFTSHSRFSCNWQKQPNSLFTESDCRSDDVRLQVVCPEISRFRQCPGESPANPPSCPWMSLLDHCDQAHGHCLPQG